MISTKDIIHSLPNNSDFREWFLDNAKVLAKDINEFFKKFNGSEISVETVKPLTSWSIPIPKEFKTNLYNTLAKLNGQRVIASYGVKDSEFNKMVKEAIKENIEIECSDDVKSYLKVNYAEFYKTLFDVFRSYETLGNKSAEPIAKIISNRLGAEKGRPVKFCEEFKTYLVKLIKNVIDSINNNMKNVEKPITASSVSVESVLKGILTSAKAEAVKKFSGVTTEFSKSDSMMCGEIKLFNSNVETKLVFCWTKNGINVNTFGKNNGYVSKLKETALGISDFDELKKLVKEFIEDSAKEFAEIKSNEVKSNVEVKEVGYDDLTDICKVILNGNYGNELKAKANLYLSLCSASDINSAYMETLGNSILAEYKAVNSVEVTLGNPILSSIKKMMVDKFNCGTFSSKVFNANECLVCFLNDYEFDFYVIGNDINCSATIVSNGVNVSNYEVKVTDERTTLTNIECWVKGLLEAVKVQVTSATVKLTPKPIKDLLNELGLVATLHKDRDGQSFHVYKIKGTEINSMLGGHNFTLNVYYKANSNSVTVQTEDSNDKYVYYRDIVAIEELRKVLESAVADIKSRD